jgi:glucose-1-phosphate thymidylyltransferase
MQPLAFSKELLPVGSRFDGPIERPRAVSEHLVERMLAAGATKLCFVIAPGKSDILEYYAGSIGDAKVCYLVQQRPAGLCDAIFQAAPFIAADDDVLVGLPDTLWFPVEGLRDLPGQTLSFLLFPVDRPELFDAVLTGPDDDVLEIQVKRERPSSSWIWGAFRMPGAVLHELRDLWMKRDAQDEYIGTLVNAYLALGGRAIGLKSGTAYVDVGTFNGYREANRLLLQQSAAVDLPPVPAKLAVSSR